MQAYIDWMSQRRMLNVILIIVYYILVVAPHKVFGTFLNTVVFKGITRDQYNMYVLIAALLALICYSFLFLKNTLQRSDKKKLWFYMLANTILATLIIKYLFVINIEVVHFPQYAAFAILVYPLLHNYRNALIWTTLAGVLDEAYQNFYLAPKDTGYFDWNDVLTNLVGAVFGLLLLRSLGIVNKPIEPWYRSSGVIATFAIIVMIGIMCLTGFLSIYPSETSTFQLVSKELSGFWQTVHQQ